jgi:hypothetical protein
MYTMRKTKSKKYRRYKLKYKKTRRNKSLSGGGNNTVCNIFDSYLIKADKNSNNCWRTCIQQNGVKNDILYITPINVLIKSIETIQHPDFLATLDRSEPKKIKMMIEGKYINCFLKIQDKWYAIMRLFGTTLNTGIFAFTEKNKAFYRLNNIDIDLRSTVDDHVVGNGLIQLNSSQFIQKNQDVNINPEFFQNITSQDSVYDLLRNFRLQKIHGNAEKTGLADIIGKNVFLDLIKQ